MYLWVFIICMAFNAFSVFYFKTSLDQFLDRTMFQGFALLLLLAWSGGWFEWIRSQLFLQCSLLTSSSTFFQEHHLFIRQHTVCFLARSFISCGTLVIGEHVMSKEQRYECPNCGSVRLLHIGEHDKIAKFPQRLLCGYHGCIGFCVMPTIKKEN